MLIHDPDTCIFRSIFPTRFRNISFQRIYEPRIRKAIKTAHHFEGKEHHIDSINDKINFIISESKMRPYLHQLIESRVLLALSSLFLGSKVEGKNPPVQLDQFGCNKIVLSGSNINFQPEF